MLKLRKKQKQKDLKFNKKQMQNYMNVLKKRKLEKLKQKLKSIFKNKMLKQ